MYNLDTFQVYAQNLAFSIQIGSFVYFSVFLHLISFLKCVRDLIKKTEKVELDQPRLEP